MTTMEFNTGSGDNGDGPGTDKVGLIIDRRYRITSLLGRGGMGSVYRARHVKLQRDVAIKLLHPSHGRNADIARRFEREAFASARLDHPNCVHIADFGELDDGSLYLVMELLTGASLGDVLHHEGCLSVARALHITLHVLRGLAHAHAAGVVHRDVKPDNIILVQRGDDPDFARILDFGIAKLMGDAHVAEGGAKLTQAGVAFGTPMYMPPEQALGQVADHRADLYSTSVMLFEMIAGVPPFVSDNNLDLLMMHVSQDIPSLAQVAPTVRISAQLEHLIRRGLAKKPDDRFASAARYIEAIEDCLERATVRPDAPAPGVRATADGGTASLGRDVAAAAAPTAAALPAGDRASLAMPVRVTGLPTGDRASVGPTTSTGPSSPPRALHDQLRDALQLVRDPRTFRRHWRRILGYSGAVILAVLILANAADCGSDAAIATHDSRSLQRHVDKLAKGKKCKDRKKAVSKLRALGDKRAIPALQEALYRPYRGGVLNLQTKNANRCLEDEAAAAIEYLERL